VFEFFTSFVERASMGIVGRWVQVIEFVGVLRIGFCGPVLGRRNFVCNRQPVSKTDLLAVARGTVNPWCVKNNRRRPVNDKPRRVT